MAVFWNEGATVPGIGSGLQAVLRRRLTEAGGLALLAVGAALTLALATYHAGDPSHFSASGAAPRNWLGRPGAVLADPLIRFLGLGAGVLAAFPAVWGLRFLRHAGEERIWARLLLLPVAVLAVAVFASTHAVPQGWPLALGLGGILGDAGAEALLALAPVAPETAVFWLTLLLAPVAVLGTAAALGCTWGEAGTAGRWMLRSLAETAPIPMSRSGTASGSRPRPRNDDGEAPRSWRPRLPSLALPALRIPSLRRPAPEMADDEPETAPRRDPAVSTPRASAPARAAGDDDGAASALSTAIRALRAGPKPQRIAETEPDLAAADRETAPIPSRPIAINEGPELPEDDETLMPDPAPRPRAMPPASGAPEPYDAPSLALLARADANQVAPVSEAELYENARQLETVLADYGVRGEITAVKAGPVVTLYELEPAPGLKASRVIGLADDIARSMSALSARVSTVPGRTVIGIELPNPARETVFLREVLESADYAESRHPLALALGHTIEGAPCIANLAKMPHLLIAGTTGSGKSVAINTMILSLLYRLSPDQCRLIMIDPKMLELSVYDGIPHLLAPVVTDPKKAIVALKWVVAEMEDRYRKMSKLGVRNIDGYNARVRDALARGEDFSRTVQTGFDEETGEPLYETETFAPEPMPLIVVIVDEMADLMMVAGKEIEACIQRLAQMARASGIHLIMATQRPSVDVITGTIKANFPTRISFQVTSKIDSRTILGEQGAEQLLGQGDMLYMAGGGRIRRVHGPFVSDDEVEEVVRHLKTLGVPDYVDAVTDGGDDDMQALVDEKLGLGAPGDSDETLYDKAVAIVARDRKCSTSYIQRKLQIGYNKAARLVEEMEQQGVVTPSNAVGKREILIEER